MKLFRPVGKPPGRNGKQAGRILLACLLLFVFLISLGAVCFALEATFVAWWLPIGTGAACAIPLTWLTRRFWPWLTGIARWWPNAVAAMLMFSAVDSCAILMANYASALQAQSSRTAAVVTGKARVTKHHTRRVGRRYVQTGSIYYVYELNAKMYNGRDITLTVPVNVYNSTKQGDTLGLPVAKGILGWEVADIGHVAYPKHTGARHHRRTRHVPSAGH